MTTRTPGSQPPYPPQYPPPSSAPSQRSFRWGALALAALVLLIGLFLKAQADAQRPRSPGLGEGQSQSQSGGAAVSASGPVITPTLVRTPTPVPTVAGPSWQEYSAREKQMTDAQWAQYIGTLDGTYIAGWQGWVLDVTRDSEDTYNLKVDMDGPNEVLAAYELRVKIPAQDATTYNKHEKVDVSGRIQRVECSMGVCVVVVDSATVVRR